MNHLSGSSESSTDFVFEDDVEGDQFKLTIYESFDKRPDYSLQIWPSAAVLAQYIWRERSNFKDKVILELGSGTALCGLVAAKVGSPKVILTDLFMHSKSMDVCRKNITQNGLNSSRVQLQKLCWGDLDDLIDLPELDYIIASDCFYDEKDYENILVTISFLLRHKCPPGGSFLTTVQARDAFELKIWCSMHKWGLKAAKIPLESFEADETELLGTRFPGNSIITLYKFEVQN
ncbi:Methyltransferase-like protein 23 [Halotydeus destructor]|nr:Methyltransferase-like protein 23 [Halotydeus destructor]